MVAPIAEKNRYSKGLMIAMVFIIILLIAALVFGYFMLRDREFFDASKLLVGKGVKEETILLDEFVVNLKSENNKKSYLKVQMALMYTDVKQAETIKANVNKIRDIIINNILDKSASEVLEKENIKTFKEEIKESINLALYGELIKDIYITDITVQ